tara:strand:+ start:151 stop:987 length:837 start_codon:yes stop_codon:yes gene_type:complete
MKKDLRDTTFVIPIRIESEDRLRNVITICCFLLENFNTRIILKEVDSTSIFEERALPQIKRYLDNNVDDLTHIFEKIDPDDPIFYRMRYINQMLSMVDTKVVANYDCDVLLPISTYLKSEKAIVEDGFDAIYPYAFGDENNGLQFCRQVWADDDVVSSFLSEDCNFSILDSKSTTAKAQYGHVQFFNKSSYIDAGMENENFRSWGPEDQERYYRFEKLGYKIGRVNDYVYHIEHSRGQDSDYANPYHGDNVNLFNYLKSLTQQELRSYYSSQKYLRKY